jgi:putative glutamine amidotransferase
MIPRQPRPLVGVTACMRTLAGHPFHMAGDKYMRAVTDGMGALAVVIPALGASVDPQAWAAHLDGLLVTGSESNVEPHHYGGPPSPPDTLHDADRDATTLPLICAAIAAGVPMLGICRGMQELNVALGGTLHAMLHEVPGFDDHREDESAPLDVQYGPVHPVCLTGGGYLAGLASSCGLAPDGEFAVNSLHGQGIDRLAPGLTVEARARDGVIEAVRVTDAPAFAVAVQWHPEWRFQDDRLSAALFIDFAEAATRRASRRLRADRGWAEGPEA